MADDKDKGERQGTQIGGDGGGEQLDPEEMGMTPAERAVYQRGKRAGAVRGIQESRKRGRSR